MLCQYSPRKSRSLTQVYATVAEIQNFLSGGLLFLLAHLVEDGFQLVSTWMPSICRRTAVTLTFDL